MTDNISVFEEYLFAQDKREFLESCKNASEIKKYIRICHLLSQPEVELEQVDKDLLQNWKNYSNYGDKKSLVLKSELHALLAETDAAKRVALMTEFNHRYLGFSFNDYRDSAGTQAQTVTEGGDKQVFKTSLTEDDHKEMRTSTKLAELMDSEHGNLSFSVNDLGISNLRTIDFAKVKSWRVKETLFGFLPRYSSAEVVVLDPEHRRDLGCLQGVPTQQGQEPVQLADPRTHSQQINARAA